MTKPKPKIAPAPVFPPISTFCAFPRTGSHGYCHEHVVARGRPCHCPCHTQEPPPSYEGFDPSSILLAPAPEPTTSSTRVTVSRVPERNDFGAAMKVLAAIDPEAPDSPMLTFQIDPNRPGQIRPTTDRDRHRTQGYKTRSEASSLMAAVDAGIARLKASEHPTIKVHLAPVFWDDHVSRAGTKNNPFAGHQVELRRYVKTAYVELDAVGYDDLLADATWFVDPANGTAGLGNVVVSARATVRALTKAGRPA